MGCHKSLAQLRSLRQTALSHRQLWYKPYKPPRLCYFSGSFINAFRKETKGWRDNAAHKGYAHNQKYKKRCWKISKNTEDKIIGLAKTQEKCRACYLWLHQQVSYAVCYHENKGAFCCCEEHYKIYPVSFFNSCYRPDLQMLREIVFSL